MGIPRKEMAVVKATRIAKEDFRLVRDTEEEEENDGLGFLR